MITYLICGIKTLFVAKFFGHHPSIQHVLLWPIYLLACIKETNDYENKI